MNYVVVSGYTPPYRDRVRKLIESLDRLCVPESCRRIVQYEHRGSWERNCAHKPSIVIDALRETQKPVLWVDADATVELPPVLIDDFIARGVDYSFRVKENDHPFNKALSGTVFINNTAQGVLLAAMWREYCNNRPTDWDQVSLWHAHDHIRAVAPTSKFEPLHDAYCAIFDELHGSEHHPRVIVHHQASRTLKHVVGSDGE